MTKNTAQKDTEMSKKKSEGRTEVAFEFVPVKAIVDCEWNGSRLADGELVASVKAQGVLQPVGLCEIAGGKFAIAYGTRRVDAARKAKLDSVPAMVYPASISDEEAQGMTIAENLNRMAQDPVQESRIFALMKKGGVDEKEIAARVGKSEKFVRRRMKLAELDAEVADSIDWSVAKVECIELLATLPREKQRTIAETRPYMLSEYGDLNSEILGIGDLSQGKFDPEDALLVPAVGSCLGCERRTGAQKLLFDEEGYENDHCLDSACFSAKCDAAIGRAISKLREKHPTAICVYDEWNHEFDDEGVFKLHEARKVNHRDLEFCKAKDAGAQAAIDLSRGAPSKVCYVRAPDKSGSTDKRQNRPTTPEDKVEMLGKRRLAWVAEKVRTEIQRAEAFADKYENWESLAKIAAAFGGYSPKTADFEGQSIADVGLHILNASQRNLQTLAQVYSVTEIDRTELDTALTTILDLLTGNGLAAMKQFMEEAEQEIPMPKTLAKELAAK